MSIYDYRLPRCGVQEVDRTNFRLCFHCYFDGGAAVAANHYDQILLAPGHVAAQLEDELILFGTHNRNGFVPNRYLVSRNALGEILALNRHLISQTESGRVG